MSWLLLWRLSLFAMIVVFWPVGVRVCAAHYRWNEERQQFIRQQRWRVALWLIVLELVLVQGILFRFLQALEL